MAIGCFFTSSSRSTEVAEEGAWEFEATSSDRHLRAATGGTVQLGLGRAGGCRRDAGEAQNQDISLDIRYQWTRYHMISWHMRLFHSTPSFFSQTRPCPS